MQFSGRWRRRASGASRWQPTVAVGERWREMGKGVLLPQPSELGVRGRVQRSWVARMSDGEGSGHSGLMAT